MTTFIIAREGDIPHFIDIDEDDLEWAKSWSWAIKRSRPKKDGSLPKPYAYRIGKKGGRRTSLWLHKEVCERAQGAAPPDKPIADHLNGRSLDCSRSNLRWADAVENRANIGGAAAC